MVSKPHPERIGPYQILGLIGTGGMSNVYRARKDGADSDIALKVLSEERVQKSPVFLGRFQREVSAMMALSHPNIVAIQDAGEVDGYYYLAMELMEGRSLKERTAVSPMDEPELMRLIREITDALAYCHALGVLHRDLKPTNVFLLPDGTAKLLDFGLAKAAKDEPLTSVGRRIGTPRYMPPEVVRGTSPDTRSELYQLGLMFYEAAAGRPAFPDPDVVTVLRKVVSEEPPSIAFFNEALPRSIMMLIKNCIAKLPDCRYQSCTELLADLDLVAAGQPISLRA